MGAVSTNPYTSQAIAGYNASPPADDGSQVASNKLEWAKHKTKLADPIKTLSESVNTAVLSAFAKTVNTDADVRNQLSGSLAFEWATATIGTDVLAINVNSALAVGAESGATQDTLQRLSATGVYSGALVVLKQRHATEEIFLIHATSTAATATDPNLFMTGQSDYLIDDRQKSVMLVYDSQVATSTGWYQVGGGLAAANQTQVEAITSNGVAITPLNAKWLPGYGKACALVDRSAGTPALATGYGISSLTDDGAAQTIVNLTTQMTSTNYIPVVSSANTGAAFNICAVWMATTLATGSFKVHQNTGGGVDQDATNFSLVVLGDYS